VVSKAVDQLFEADSGLAQVFSLRHDFPSEWAAFTAGTADFAATIRRDFFPYFVRDRKIVVTSLEVYTRNLGKRAKYGDIDSATADLADQNKRAFSLVAAAGPALSRTADDAFLLIKYDVNP
jgi:hypothetical protein